MIRKKLLVVILPVSVLIVTFALFTTDRISRDNIQHYVPWSIAKLLYPSDDVFSEYASPLEEIHWIYDAGVVDANGDGLLDIFTTNHNWRQRLLLADGQGGYRDVLSAWGLDQSHEFPGIEISTTPPEINNPGVYIYWYNRHLYIRTHSIGNQKPISITLHALTELKITSNNGFRIDEHKSEDLTSDLITDSKLRLSTIDDAIIELFPRSRGVPMNFKLDAPIPLTYIYVGNQLVSPQSYEFSLPLQDRHAMAWSDFNNDEQLDIFITRGAIGGTLRAYPQSIVDTVHEELYVSKDGEKLSKPRFENIISRSGIAKNGCSARHANWVDFNRDGLLDLFINCEDVGNIKGEYPNKLYQQDTKQQFVEVAEQSGLAVLDHNIIDYEWFDADNDGDMDLFTHQDNGLHLYRNNKGQFKTEFIYRGKFARIDNPELKGIGSAYWIFDGKLSVSDYDGDGDLDVFAASKKGNALLINNGGAYTPVDPLTIGLPANSVSASWVDYDNDGLPDLHTVPAGIFRQRKDHSFNPTNLLTLPQRTYMASIINWYDLNNDGTRDALIALNENPSLHRWWELSPKDKFKWTFLTYQNKDTRNHWLQIKLIGKAGNREAIGSRVTLITPDGQQIQEIGSSEGSFYSQGHYRLYFGLGHHSKADSVKIRWSDGEIQELLNVAGDSLLVIDRYK
ncbi:CRTAC1 family protein [Gammaproteobacteria bacterium]|nr:CRTAC1 family protein [Gammaproteobacteria bacterium]